MPLYPFRRPRTSQPQGPVRVDRANPLVQSAKLKSVWSGADRGRDAIGQTHGVLTNGATVGPTTKGLAFKLDGVDDIVSFGLTRALETANNRLVMFARIMRTGAMVDFSGIVNSGKTSVNEGGYMLVGTATNALRFYVYTATGWVSATTAVTNISQWYDVCCTWDGANIRVYLDGVLQATTACADIVYPATVAQPACLGQYTTDEFPGYIALAGFGNGSLSDQQVKILSANPWQIFQPEEVPIGFLATGGVGLVLADIAHAHSLATIALTQAHGLAVENVAHSHSLGSVNLTQAHALALEAIAHAHALDTIALTQTHNLALVDVAHSHTLDSVALSQAHNLVPADVAHAHTIDSVALNVGGTLLIADIVHGHNLDSINFTQAHNLSLANIAHGHTLDSVALSQAHNLGLSDISHAHTIDSVALNVGGTLLIADIVHGHNLDSINFTQAHNLSLTNSAHAHTLESVALSQAHNLALENIAHGHTAQAIAFGAGTGLLVGSPGYLISRTARNWSINRTARNWRITS